MSVTTPAEQYLQYLKSYVLHRIVYFTLLCFILLLCSTIRYRDDLSRVLFTKLHLSLGEAIVAQEEQNEARDIECAGVAL